MTATATSPEAMDIAGDGNSIPSRRVSHVKATRENILDGDVAGVLGQALPHVSYSVDSDPSLRGMITSTPAEDDVDTPSRRYTHEVGGGGPRDTSGSEEGYEYRTERDAGSSRAGSNESIDSCIDRRTRQRRDVGSSASSSRRNGDRSRDPRHRYGNGCNNDSATPRSDRGGTGGGRGDAGNGRGDAGNGRGSDIRVEMPSRRRPGGDGLPKEIEPSKVLHVRNVGHPVVQADLVSLLSCFGQVEKVKMFNAQALVQLPSVSIAKATMHHFEHDGEARIGNRKVYINYSRSRSIEGRDIEPLNSTSFSSRSNNNNNSSSHGGGGGITNAGNNVLAAARTGAGSDGNGHMDTAGPYAHLIIEDHARLLGLATTYLQNYGIPGGEGAVLNINQREDMAEYQRQALAAAMVLNGGGTGTAGIATWSPATTAGGGRFATGMSTSGSHTGFSTRPRSGSRSQPDDEMYRPPPRNRGGRGGPSQR